MDSRTIFDRYEDGKYVSYEKNVLALLEQCKDAGLTVAQTKFVLSAADSYIDRAVSRSPLPF